MARNDKQDAESNEALEVLEYLQERAERALAELKRKQARRVVIQLKAAPLPKMGT